MIFNIGDRVELLVTQTGDDIWGDGDATVIVEKGSVGSVVVYDSFRHPSETPFVLFDCLNLSWMMLDTELKLLEVD